SARGDGPGRALGAAGASAGAAIVLEERTHRSMKIATWNVNGIRARQDEVVAFVEREQPDVLCLQEIKAAADHIPKPVGELPGYWCYWHGTKGYSGVAVASIYVPNGGKDFAAKMRFLEALAAYAAGLRALGKPAILCGDLNVARAPIDVNVRDRDDRAIGQRPDEREVFGRILTEGGLHDLAREREPENDALFTWWAPWRNLRQRNIGWRIDYLLVSGDL